MTKPPLTSFAITGLGIISGAGKDVTETTEFIFGRASPKILKSPSPFMQIQIRPEWLDQLQLSADTPAVNVFCLLAVTEALQSAGLNQNDLHNLRVGVCLGSTVGTSVYDAEFSREFNQKKFPAAERLLAHFKYNLSQFVSRRLHLKGPALLVSNACTSGADAIGIAKLWLETDQCDVVICGGAESILPQIYAGFKSMQLCSAEICKPFDANRSGLTLGEGAGIIILEKLSSPRVSKALLHGYATASDAHHPTAPHPEARGLRNAIHLLNKTQIQNDLKRPDFINAHGTATLQNDLAEGRLIKNNLPGILVVATKAYTGHCLAAAGAIEAVITCLSLQSQELPVTKGFSNMDPEIGFRPTSQNIKGKFKSAYSFSLGFGGTNTVLHLGQA